MLDFYSKNFMFQGCKECMFANVCNTYLCEDLKGYLHCRRFGIKVKGEQVKATNDTNDIFFNKWKNCNDKAVKSVGLLKHVTKSCTYNDAGCIGDILMKEKVDLYINERNKIIEQSDNKERILFYENLLIKDDITAWWYHYSKTYIWNVCKLYKNIKRKSNKEDEYKALMKFWESLPMIIQTIGLYGMDNIKTNKELINYFKELGVVVKNDKWNNC